MAEASRSVSGGSVNAWQLMSGDWSWKHQAHWVRLEGQGVEF